MIDAINIATSGMMGNERGLNVISNNVANLNTAGFRGSTVSFANVFDGSTGSDGQGEAQQPLGGGVDASRVILNTQPGNQVQTGQSLDLYLKGDGFFVLRDANGAIRYTREGSFSFDANQQLVSNAAVGQTLTVMSRDANGNLVPIDMRDLQASAGTPTTEVVFTNDLSPSDTNFTIDSVTVYDNAGKAHTLQLDFVKDATPITTLPHVTVSWTVNVSEGGQQIGSGELAFSGSTVTPGSSPLSMSLALQGADPANISFNFDQVLGNDQGPDATGQTSSNLAVASQDGVASGTPTSETFDSQGVLQVTYSNGKTASGAKLAFAAVADQSDMVELSNSLLEYQGSKPVVLREAGPDLQVVAQSLEGSNVDLTTEFSNLILMQRAYQGSSQVVSTANDMMQQLLDIRSDR